MVASAMTRRGALAALGAFGLSLTGAASGALAQSGLRFGAVRVNVEPLRALTGDPTAAWMELGARAGFASSVGASFCAWRQERAGPGGPDRLDLSRLEPRRPGAAGFGAGHDHRKLPCPGTTGRNRVANPVAGDCVLLPERRRPGARRASLSRAHCCSRAGLRWLGAAGAWTLGARRFVDRNPRAASVPQAAARSAASRRTLRTRWSSWALDHPSRHDAAHRSSRHEARRVSVP
jgi:hypothetical protein